MSALDRGPYLDLPDFGRVTLDALLAHPSTHEFTPAHAGKYDPPCAVCTLNGEAHNPTGNVDDEGDDPALLRWHLRACRLEIVRLREQLRSPGGHRQMSNDPTECAFCGEPLDLHTLAERHACEADLLRNGREDEIVYDTANPVSRTAAERAADQLEHVLTDIGHLHRGTASWASEMSTFALIDHPDLLVALLCQSLDEGGTLTDEGLADLARAAIKSGAMVQADPLRSPLRTDGLRRYWLDAIGGVHSLTDEHAAEIGPIPMKALYVMRFPERSQEDSNDGA